jgi:hypothetical protein
VVVIVEGNVYFYLLFAWRVIGYCLLCRGMCDGVSASDGGGCMWHEIVLLGQGFD